MKCKIEKADSFLGRHAGINYKEFMNLYKNGNGVDKEYATKVLTLFSSFEDIENMGANIGKILDTIKENSSTFMMPLEGDIVNSKVKSTLDKYITARDKNFGLRTLVSTELINEMKSGNINGQVLTGKKYLDIKSGILFDVLLDIEDMKNIAKINKRETPVVPYFSYGNAKMSNEYFISLNEQHPEIKKILRCARGGDPALFQLEDGKFNLCSYLSINEGGRLKPFL
jgi:hypothetical protein